KPANFNARNDVLTKSTMELLELAASNPALMLILTSLNRIENSVQTTEENSHRMLDQFIRLTQKVDENLALVPTSNTFIDNSVHYIDNSVHHTYIDRSRRTNTVRIHAPQYHHHRSITTNINASQRNRYNTLVYSPTDIRHTDSSHHFTDNSSNYTDSPRFIDSRQRNTTNNSQRYLSYNITDASRHLTANNRYLTFNNTDASLHNNFQQHTTHTNNLQDARRYSSLTYRNRNFNADDDSSSPRYFSRRSGRR
ncbi:MAG: hypothetical protein ACK4PR_08630, partial [Gammaproteobacteria bacterium]